MDIIMIAYLVAGGCAFFALIQLIYTWVIFGKLAFYKVVPSITKQEKPVSIIIAARNELDNLQQNLPAILEQDYPVFEVVVVNDCSWDESQALLETMLQQYKHLKVSQLIEQDKYPTGKKFALTIGIKAAMYDTLLFTDADCVPASNQWLRLMQNKFTPGKDIVLGFSPYIKYGGFLNLYIRFETLMTAMFYFSMALMKNTFMGVGRNLAYNRELFFKNKGFASHNHIMSGDDDLFINQAATASNVAIELSPESFVYTDPKKDFAAFSRQKSRHLTTGKYYKCKHKMLLGLFYSSHLLFYSTLIAALILNPLLWPFMVGIYGLRLISQVIVYYNTAKKLKCTSVVWALPILDFVYLIYIFTFGTKGLFTRKRKAW